MKKKVALLLAGVMAATCFTGCGSKKSTAGDTEHMRYWMPLDAGSAQTVSEYGETPFAKEWQKRTGVDLEFVHPPQGQAGEKFSIMIVSGDLPDIVEYSWNTYPGGVDKAVSDGCVLKLNDMIEKNSPAFYRYLQENPELDKAAKTDAGFYTGYPGIMGDPSLAVSAGLYLRKDWLNDLSLAVPETIDEWETDFNSVRRSRTMMLISNFVCIAFGLVLILVSVKRNYNLMNELLKLLDKKFENSETRENEFD